MSPSENTSSPTPTCRPAECRSRGSRWASATACPAASSPSQIFRSRSPMASGNSSPSRRQSRPFTSPAIRTGSGEAPKRVIGPTPLRPAVRFSQKVSRPLPTGLVTPMPVISTRFIPPPMRTIRVRCRGRSSWPKPGRQAIGNSGQPKKPVTPPPPQRDCPRAPSDERPWPKRPRPG